MNLLRNVGQVAIFAFLSASCLWPAVYNGGPLLDSDTPAYVRYADVAVSKFTKHPPEWLRQPGSAAPSTSATSASREDGSNAGTPFLGRSIYYGMLLKLGDAYGMMWPSIVLQAAALVLVIALTLFNTTGFNWLAFCILTLLLVFTTPLAFFASRLMPDTFAGIAILATANLIVYGSRMSRAPLVAWIGLLGASLLFHSTHVLIAFAIVATYLSGRLFFRVPTSAVGLAGVTFCILIAFAGDAVFSVATTKAFGVTPIRPPFLTARIIADGPGEAYLKASCPASGFSACRFVDRLPTTADKFLWSPDATKGGIFSAADPSTRRALSAEQFRFVLAVLRYEPLGETSAMVRNAVKQFGMISMVEFNLNSQDRREFQEVLPLRYLKAAEETRSWGGTMPVALMSAVTLTVLAVSAVYLTQAVLLSAHRPMNDDHLRRLAIVVIFGILVNAFVCGAMSDPYDRYQSRVVWLVPFVAGLIFPRNFTHSGLLGKARCFAWFRAAEKETSCAGLTEPPPAATGKRMCLSGYSSSLLPSAPRSSFLLNALVSRVKRRICIRIGRFWRSAKLVLICLGSGRPSIRRFSAPTHSPGL